MPFPDLLPQRAPSIRDALLPGPLQMDSLCFFRIGPLCFLQIFLTSLVLSGICKPSQFSILRGFCACVISSLIPKCSQSLVNTAGPRGPPPDLHSICSGLQSPGSPQRGHKHPHSRFKPMNPKHPLDTGKNLSARHGASPDAVHHGPEHPQLPAEHLHSMGSGAFTGLPPTPLQLLQATITH